MLALPFELQVLVIENLDALEILNIQLTCKSLQDVVEKSGKAIWRSCLDRYCARNGLFKPSFGALTTESDIKRAATASLRFTKAHRRAIASGENREISQRKTRLEFPQGELPQAEGNINELFLVPGGRFLFTFNDSAFHIWDIADAPKSTLVHKQSVERMLDVAYTNIVASERMHLIYEVEEDWPEGYAPHTPDEGPWDTVTTSQFLELSMDDQEWHSKDHGRFTLIHPEDCGADAFSLVDDKVVMLIGGVTVVWNFVDNTYAAWKLGGGATKPVEVFTNSGYVMYISNEGVHGVRFPDFQPFPKGYVVLSDIQTSIPPAFSFRHEAVYDLDPTSDLIPIHAFGPDICTPVDGERPFIYDVRQKASKPEKFPPLGAVQSFEDESPSDIDERIAQLPSGIAEAVQEYIMNGYQIPQQEVQPLTYSDHLERQFREEQLYAFASGNFTARTIGSLGSTDPESLPNLQPESSDMHVHRYRFSVNPAEPWKSALERVFSHRAVARGQPTNLGDVLFANYYERCDGSTVTLWKESLWDEQDEVNRKGALLLSMSEVPLGPLQADKGKGVAGDDSDGDLGELPLVPLLDLHSDSYQITDDSPYPGDCMVDPASAKAVVLWTDDQAVAYVEVIDIE